MKGGNWHAQAACGDEPDAMFPGTSAAKIHKAKALCGTCPVRQQCLEDAMEAEGNTGKCRRYGIRGGLTPTGRRRLYEELQRRAKAAV